MKDPSSTHARRWLGCIIAIVICILTQTSVFSDDNSTPENLQIVFLGGFHDAKVSVNVTGALWEGTISTTPQLGLAKILTGNVLPAKPTPVHIEILQKGLATAGKLELVATAGKYLLVAYDSQKNKLHIVQTKEPPVVFRIPGKEQTDRTR